MRDDLPQVQENVDPIEENIWDLGGKAQISDEICAIIRVNTRIILAHFIVNEVLKYRCHNHTQLMQMYIVRVREREGEKKRCEENSIKIHSSTRMNPL